MCKVGASLELEQVLSWSRCRVGASVELEQVLSWSRC